MVHFEIASEHFMNNKLTKPHYGRTFGQIPRKISGRVNAKLLPIAMRRADNFKAKQIRSHTNFAHYAIVF